MELRQPHFRGCYVQDSMELHELGPEDVSLLKGLGPRLAVIRPLTHCGAVTLRVYPCQIKAPHTSQQVELHLHMDGACRVETLKELSRLYKLDYPHDDVEEFKKCVMILSPAPSLASFLEVFGALSEILW